MQCRHEAVTAVLSINSLLITFHHSLLEIGFFLFFSAQCMKGKRGKEAFGRRRVGGPTIKHHHKSRRSIHDIRLNEYMNPNETRTALF